MCNKAPSVASSAQPLYHSVPTINSHSTIVWFIATGSKLPGTWCNICRRLRQISDDWAHTWMWLTNTCKPEYCMGYCGRVRQFRFIYRWAVFLLYCSKRVWQNGYKFQATLKHNWNDYVSLLGWSGPLWSGWRTCTPVFTPCCATYNEWFAVESGNHCGRVFAIAFLATAEVSHWTVVNLIKVSTGNQNCHSFNRARQITPFWYVPFCGN